MHACERQQSRAQGKISQIDKKLQKDKTVKIVEANSAKILFSANKITGVVEYMYILKWLQPLSVRLPLKVYCEVVKQCCTE